MTKYAIYVEGKGVTSSAPYDLTKGANIDKLVSFDGHKKYVDMKDTFQSCTALTEIKNVKFTTTNFASMFQGCTSLANISNVDFSSAIQSNSMFQGCTSLVKFDASMGSFPKVTNSPNMFQNCSKLTSVSVDFSGSTNIFNMFNGCGKLESVTSDLSAAENCINAFQGCWELKVLPSSFPACTNAENMFLQTGGIAIENFNIYMPNVKNVKGMFSSSKIRVYRGDLTNVEGNTATDSNSCYNMFQGCDNIAEVRITTNSNNAALFTHAALNSKSAVKLYVNDTEVPYVAPTQE